MPLLARSQAKQAFATCNERDRDARRELVEGTRGAAIPATPLQDFARHCYTNYVRNIIIQNCISCLHSGISAHGAMSSLQRSFIMTCAG